MTDVRPFRGLRFARDPEPRIAGPYDVISPAEREALAREPENIVHLTLPPGPEGKRDYASAARTLEAWRKQGTLVRDPEPCLYVLEEQVAEGRVRRGLLGLLRLASYDEGVVLPHERTMAGPRQDRLLLTREVRANLEPVFFLYEDRDLELAPLLEQATRTRTLTSCRGPDGTALALGRIEDAATIAEVRAFLADRPVVIADGHHRYETMLRYRDECREARRSAGRGPDPDEPQELVMGYLGNAFDPGSRIRAIHRVLCGEVHDAYAVLAAAGFDLEERDATEPAGDLLEALRARGGRAHALAFVLPEGPVLLATRQRGLQLDVEVLHAEILPALGGRLGFDSRPGRLLDRVRGGEASLGILLNPLDPDALFRVVEAGSLLPQKSTFFSPKIPSGLVVRDFWTEVLTVS